MKSLHQVMSSCARLRDLVDLNAEETLQYDPYDDELHNAEAFPMLDEEPEVTPQVWEPICKCRNIASEKGQDGQRLSDMLEA